MAEAAPALELSRRSPHLPGDVSVPAARVAAAVGHPQVRALIAEVLRRARPAVVVAVGQGAGPMLAAVTPGGDLDGAPAGVGDSGGGGEWQRALVDMSSLSLRRERPPSAWDGSRRQIPPIDLPYGVLRWQATSGDRASQARRSGQPSPDYFQIVMPGWAAALRPATLSRSRRQRGPRSGGEEEGWGSFADVVRNLQRGREYSHQPGVMDDDLLGEQQAFYRARAPRYDDWWRGQGRYVRSEEQAQQWDREVAIVEEALEAFGPRGEVLELAGETGWWTARLARFADHLTVVDGSPEVLAINREQVGRPDVDYVVADVFSWEPERLYDVVFFSFWLSHVPRTHFRRFWDLVRRCIGPGGRVFFIDNRAGATPGIPGADPYVSEYRADLHVRRLEDGSEYRVVKVTYQPEELTALLDAAGWRARISATEWFIFGSATLVTRDVGAGARPPTG